STSRPKRSSKCKSTCWAEPRCCSKAWAMASRCNACSFSIVGWVSINLLVIGGAPQVLVRQRRTGRRRIERKPILLGSENVLHGAEAIRAEVFGAVTGRFQPIGAVFRPERHQAEAGAIALLRVRAPGEEARDKAAGGRPGLLGPRDQPRRRPLHVRAMGARHVLYARGIPTP